MSSEIDRMHAYLSAIDSAAHAIAQARALRPDMALDHALERLRALLVEGGTRLQELEDAADPAERGILPSPVRASQRAHLRVVR